MTSGDVRRRQTGLPPEFARLPMRMVRAATAARVYPHRRAEFARLTDSGLLHRLAPVFYVAVPDDRVGADGMSALEAALAGTAGRNRSVLSFTSGPHTYTSVSSGAPTDVLVRPP